MPDPRVPLLRHQFDLTWSLLEYHLDRLDLDDLLWEPAQRCWTVHRGADGRWVPDWSEEELDPVPVPTGAWVSWHIAWWWGTALDHARGRAPRHRTDVAWPGDAAGVVAGLRGLHDDWAAVLDGFTADALDAPAAFPWPPGSDRTVADMAAWVTAELMKNAAELGALRLIRRAT